MHVEHLASVPLDGAQGVAMTMLAPGTEPERVRVDVAVLAPESTLPKHPAGRDQAFYVLAGRGQVAGGDDVPVDVGPGSLVLWDAGEHHTTWATSELTAIIVQRGRV